MFPTYGTRFVRGDPGKRGTPFVQVDTKVSGSGGGQRCIDCGLRNGLGQPVQPSTHCCNSGHEPGQRARPLLLP